MRILFALRLAVALFLMVCWPARTWIVEVHADEAAAGRPRPDDRFLAGYTAAILEREFNLPDLALHVKNGVIYIDAEDLEGAQRDKLVTVLAGVQGVRGVEIRSGEPPSTPAAGAAVSDQVVALPAGARRTSAAAAIAKETGTVFLPRGHLFSPLMADPRWPRFSVAYQRYIDDPELESVAATSFGETLGLVRGDGPLDGRWQLGLQAAVFAIFDLDAPSKDLVNADYWVGIPLSYRRGRWSSLLRVFHQSSHLGDEFLLRNRVDRINLSFEGVDLKLSYDVADWARVYGGGGTLFDREPSDLEPGSLQAGLELRSPCTLLSSAARPVAAVDLQQHEENGWRTDVSARAGLQFENPWGTSRIVQLLLEYYHGRNSNGQFFERDLEYLGLSGHVQF